MTGFRAYCCLLVIALATAAEDGWRPGDHPATAPRPISGLTRPVRLVAIAGEVGGRVVDPGPPLGAAVTAGAVLRLDDALARADRDAAAAGLAQAEAEAAFRAREAVRIEGLSTAGRVSEGERDAARHAATAASLTRATAAARLAQAEVLLARHVIELPTGWQVLRRLREAGAVVQPGEPVLEVGDLSAVVAVLHLAEDELGALGAAQVAVAGRPYPISAVRVAAIADPASRKRAVEIELPGEAGGGREAVVLLALPDPSGALLVPERLVASGPDGRSVRTADGRNLRVSVLRAAGDGLLAVLPGAELAEAVLVPPARP